MESEETMKERMPPLWRRAQARGIGIGEERGTNQGIEIGERQGAMLEAQSLLLVGRKRLGQPDEGVQTHIATIQERERLEEFVRARPGRGDLGGLAGDQQLRSATSPATPVFRRTSSA